MLVLRLQGAPEFIAKPLNGRGMTNRIEQMQEWRRT